MRKDSVVALALVLIFGAGAAAQTRPSEFAEKMSTLSNADARAAFVTAQFLAEGDPDVVWPVLRNNWTDVFSPISRQQVLNAFARVPNHPHLLDVLNLGMSDFDEQVRKSAVQYLRPIALRDFSEDVASYGDWYRRVARETPEHVAAESAGRWVKRLSASEDELSYAHDATESFKNYPAARSAALDAGALDIIAKRVDRIESASNHHDLTDIGYLLRVLEPDENYLRRHMLPRIDKSNPMEVRIVAIMALGGPKNAFAVDPLLKLLSAAAGDLHELHAIAATVADSLAEIGDKRAIPALIQVMVDDKSNHCIYDLGYFGLRRLAGVEYDVLHTPPWWKDWWQQHHDELDLPEPVRKQTIH